MIIESLKPKYPIPDVTVYQFLFKDNHRIVDRNKPCYIDAEDSTKSISFADFENLILRFAAGLKFNFPDFALGDVVAMYSPSDVSMHYIKNKHYKANIYILRYIFLP